MKISALCIAGWIILGCADVVHAQADWEKRLDAARDLHAIAEAFAQPGVPKWPAIAYQPPAQAQKSSLYALSLKLFDRIEAAEHADPDFNAPGDPARAVTDYMAIAQHLRAAGGYANLLLADTCYRLATVRLCRIVMDDPRMAARGAAMLRDMRLPMADPRQVDALLKEDPTGVAPPSTRPMPRDVRGAYEMNLQMAMGRLDPRRHPSFERVGASAQRFYRTRSLLQHPNLALLFARIKYTDATAMTSATLLMLAEKNAALRKEYHAPQGEQLFKEFERAFGFSPTTGKVMEVLPEWYHIDWNDHEGFREQMWRPGVGGTNNFPEPLYAHAVDPAPFSPLKPPLRFTVRQNPSCTLAGPPVEIAASASGKSWAIIEDHGNFQDSPARPSGVRVLLNGKPQAFYPEIVLGWRADETLRRLRFSPSGERLAYVVRTAEGLKVVNDGKSSAGYLSILENSLQWSDDGSTLGFLAQHNRGHVAVINGREFSVDGMASGLALAPNGSHFGWFVQSKDGNGAALFMDGRLVANVELPNRLVFSRDGRRFAYVASGTNGKLTRIGGDRPSDIGYPGLPLAFSPDGMHLLSESLTKGSLVLDGQVIARFNENSPRHGSIVRGPDFSPDSKSVRCASGEKSVCLSIDGKLISECEGAAYFNPAGDRFIGVKKIDRLGSSITYDSFDLDFGDGQRIRRDGTCWFHVFGPDQRFFAYTSLFSHPSRPQLHVLSVDGESLPPFTELLSRSLGFSPDGSLFALATRRGAVWRFTVNGQDSPQTFDGFLSVPAYFTSPRDFRLLAVQGNDVVELNVSIQGTLPPRKVSYQRPATAPATKPTTTATPVTWPTTSPWATTRSATVVQPDTGAARPPQSAALPRRVDWNRQIVLQDTTGQQTGRLYTRTINIKGNPFIFHPTLVTREPRTIALAAAERNRGAWVDHPVLDARYADKASSYQLLSIGDNVYLGVGYGGQLDHKIGYRFFQRQLDQTWKLEHEEMPLQPYQGAFSGPIKLVEIDGQPTALYYALVPGDNHPINRLATVSRGADGKWTRSKVPLVTNYSFFDYDCVTAGGKLFLAGASAEIKWINRDGADWGKEQILDEKTRRCRLLNWDGKPTLVTENDCLVLGETGWKAQQALPNKPKMIAMDAAIIGGRPAFAYCDITSREIRFCRLTNQGWEHLILDFATSLSLSLHEENGRAVVTYVIAGGARTPLIRIEEQVSR